MTTRRILFVVTNVLTADLLLRGQLAYLGRNGWEVGLVAAPDPRLGDVAAREGCTVFQIPMVREPAPLRDAVALVRLVGVVRGFGPDLVVASTPKAGLLGTLAAAFAGVRKRLYVVRGLRAETFSGVRRRLMLAAERLAIWAATDVASVSKSLRAQLGALGIADPDVVRVPGAGASNGVDPVRFAPRSRGETMDAANVVGFVGRFTRDKGVSDLLDAFDLVSSTVPDSRLLLVGEFESGDPVSGAAKERIAQNPRIETTGFVADTAPLYRRMAVLAFPSYREGFPNAPLEAAASGVPTVGYETTGTVDAVVDQETGTLVPRGDSAALALALARYLTEPRLAHDHGAAGRERVERSYTNERVWGRWAEYYAEVAQ